MADRPLASWHPLRPRMPRHGARPVGNPAHRAFLIAMGLLTSLEPEPLHFPHHSLTGCYPLLPTFCPLSRVGADDHDAFVLLGNYLCEAFGVSRREHIVEAQQRIPDFRRPSHLCTPFFLPFAAIGMVPSTGARCICRRSIHRSAWKRNSTKFALARSRASN